jgi:ABC-type branched-subunit amino acid transport system substrate-binding protein
VRSKLFGVCLVALALLVTTACGGSAISAEKALKANQDVLGQAAGTSGDTTGTAGDTGTTGDTPATTGDPGTAVSAPGAAATTPATGGTGGTGGKGKGKGKGGGSTTPVAIGIKPGSCAGFKNQTGITDSTITIGNSSDISGPVPGLFSAAQQATKAYVAYFNATSNICGRKLSLTNLDSRTDAGADQQSYQKLCDQTFAAVGSMSAFDSGGAATAQACGLPDIRTAAVTATRNACTTCFGAQATGPYEFSNEVPDFMVKNHHDASQAAAFLYLNAGAAAENAKTQQAIETQRGMKFLYSAGIDVAEFNYGPYVQQMKSKGVKWVQFLGGYQQAVRLAQAMQSGGFKPDIYMLDPTAYDAGYVKTGGSAVDGTVVFINFTPFEESQPELNLYKKWLQQVAPGAAPTFFGEFAWSAAKLFVEQAIALGGQLTRASLVSRVSGINNWTGGGMHGPMMVGSKHSPSCVRFLQLSGGKWSPYGGNQYVCAGYSRAQ